MNNKTETPAYFSIKQLADLAKSIKTFHANANTPPTSGIPPTLSENDLLTLRETSSELDKIVEHYLQLQAILQPEVCSHNYLSAKTVIFEGKECLLSNSENSTLNDKFYDLASIVHQFQLDAASEKHLLAFYLEREPTHQENQKFYLVKQLLLCQFALSAAKEVADGSQEKISLSRHLIEKALLAFKTGKFTYCLQMMGTKTEPNKSNEDFFQILPLSLNKKMFTLYFDKEITNYRAVSKDWYQQAQGIQAERSHIEYPTNLDQYFPEEIEKEDGTKVINEDRQRVINAYTATFSPCPIAEPVTKEDTLQPDKNDVHLLPKESPHFEEPLQGLSGWKKVLKLKVNDKPYVLRLLPKNQDANKEILFMQIFAHLKMAPKIHYASPDDGVIIMDYIDSIPYWHKQKLEQGDIDILGFFLNKMNSIEIPKELGFFAESKRAKDALTKVKNCCFDSHKEDSRFDMYRDLLKDYENLKTLCMSFSDNNVCHQDFHPWNILRPKANPQWFSIIDWDFAQAGMDRLFDFATLMIYMRADSERETEFLTSYIGKTPTAYDQAKYIAFKQFSCIFSAITGLSLCENLDFDVTKEELAAVPTFKNMTFDYYQTLKLHEPNGQYKLGVMFIKQAMAEKDKQEYKDALATLESTRQQLSLR